MDIRADVFCVIAAEFGIAANAVTPDADLRGDLGADDLDLVCLVVSEVANANLHSFSGER